MQSFFLDKSVKDSISLEANFSTEPNIMKDFVDGNELKNNDFFINNPESLKIILYQDGAEIVDPLGAAKKSTN